VVKEAIQKVFDELSATKRKDNSKILRELDLHVSQDYLLCKLGKQDGVTQLQLSESLKCYLFNSSLAY